MNINYVKKVISFFIITILCNCLMIVIEDVAEICTAISVGCFICLFYYSCKYEREYFFAVLPFFFAQLLAIVVGMLLELKKLYIVEYGTYSYMVSSTIWLVIINTLMMLISYFVYSLHRNKQKICNIKLSVIDVYTIYAVIVGLSLILILGLIIYGSPVMNGMDRFAFWSGDGSNIVLHSAYVNLDICIVLVAFLIQKEKRILLVIPFLIIISLLYGEKFSKFLSWILLFAMVYFVEHAVTKKKVLCIFAVIFGFALLVGITVYYQYVEIYNHAGVIDDIWLGRLASQGAVWWGIFGQFDINDVLRFDLFGVEREITNWFVVNPDAENLGMYKLMQALVSPDMLNYHIQQGSRLTMGFPAIGYYYSGLVWLMVLELFFGMIIGFYAKRQVQAIRDNKIIITILLVKISQLMNDALIMGNFYTLFSIRLIVYVFLILIVEKIIYRRWMKVES